ncbi:uncharacterized protein MELLADRAFT_68519 [Melampsora larici-populina 98AG31]|uniref:Uncharacterized protein n=1 Tax=Melampsora larici-populina (strain 98AG31 / pathotype 3-4-7) TaxID=747676 RepID=F4S737_MELLP|nr:uncharacterized protein MELLADRAFT_68519 [Melampsora larici-populina 98AG31]EGF99569.1 hypothetical protein MELLADRAFT_68519 [Melampsora larici-populina 98AG31]
MGKSAKFYKRPTKKEKLGLSSNSAQIRSAIKLSKFNQPEKPTILKHERPKPLASSSTTQTHSLIQEEEQEVEEMDIDEPTKKKRTGLKSKVLKKSKDLDPSRKPKDYVDLYDQPDRRKKGKTSKNLSK